MKILIATDYHMPHRPPDQDDAPAYDVTLNGIYPSDFYSEKGADYYGEGTPDGRASVRLVQSLRNRPRSRVKIYRAIPKILTDSDLVGKYYKEKAYILKYGKLPPNVKTKLRVYEYYSFMNEELERLGEPKKTKITVNPGDWVTINRNYAVEHGLSLDDYRILSKTVLAKEIFTNGDSIQEWGYFP